MVIWRAATNKQTTWEQEHLDYTDAISVVASYSGERQRVAYGSRFGIDVSIWSHEEQGHEDRSSLRHYVTCQRNNVQSQIVC